MLILLNIMMLLLHAMIICIKAKEYKDAHETSIDADHYKGLISSAVRVKVWIYLTLGKIYGQAVWFDDPVYGMVDFSKYETKI